MKFMQLAERFGNLATLRGFGYSQLLQIISLSEGEEEKFIAEKAANGTPVEDIPFSQIKNYSYLSIICEI